MTRRQRFSGFAVGEVTIGCATVFRRRGAIFAFGIPSGGRNLLVADTVMTLQSDSAFLYGCEFRNDKKKVEIFIYVFIFNKLRRSVLGIRTPQRFTIAR
jgi:hypothetical protein